MFNSEEEYQAYRCSQKPVLTVEVKLKRRSRAASIAYWEGNLARVESHIKGLEEYLKKQCSMAAVLKKGLDLMKQRKL